MEGFPFAGTGWSTCSAQSVPDGETPAFHDWWAHDEAEERAAFEGFIDWVVERRKRHPDAPHLPLRRVRGLRGQAAHGEVRHPRGRGGRPAARRRLRGPLHRRAAGLRDRNAELFAQGDRAPLPPAADRTTVRVGRADRWSSTSGGSTAASRGAGRSRRSCARSATTTRWTASPPGGFASWLLERQRESGIGYLPDPNEMDCRGRRRPGSAPTTRRRHGWLTGQGR